MIRHNPHHSTRCIKRLIVLGISIRFFENGDLSLTFWIASSDLSCCRAFNA